MDTKASSGLGGPLMTELLIAVGLIGGVVAAHELGFWLGSLDRSADDSFG